MKQHKRVAIVKGREDKLRAAVRDMYNDLTYPEMISVITRICSQEVQDITKYMIRYERHDDFETPGDLAPDDEQGVP